MAEITRRSRPGQGEAGVVGGDGGMPGPRVRGGRRRSRSPRPRAPPRRSFPAGVDGRALFGEGLLALGRVLGGEDGPADLELHLQALRLRQPLVSQTDRRMASTARGPLRPDHLADLERLGQGLAVGDDPTDQADPKRLLGQTSRAMSSRSMATV